MLSLRRFVGTSSRRHFTHAHSIQSIYMTRNDRHITKRQHVQNVDFKFTHAHSHLCSYQRFVRRCVRLRSICILDDELCICRKTYHFRSRKAPYTMNINFVASSKSLYFLIQIEHGTVAKVADISNSVHAEGYKAAKRKRAAIESIARASHEPRSRILFTEFLRCIETEMTYQLKRAHIPQFQTSNSHSLGWTDGFVGRRCACRRVRT